MPSFISPTLSRLLPVPSARTGIHTVVAENAIQCVAEGTGKSLESVGEMKDGTMNLSRRKQIN